MYFTIPKSFYLTTGTGQMIEEKKELNIHQRLNEVRKHTEYVYKEGDIIIGGKAIPVTLHDTVTDYTRQPLIKFGVLIKPDLIKWECRSLEKVRRGKGGSSYSVIVERLIAEYLVTFINVDNPSDVIECKTFAMYDGGDDKAPQSLLSYAVKGVILKILSIVSGDEQISERYDDGPRYTETRGDSNEGVIDMGQDEPKKAIDHLAEQSEPGRADTIKLKHIKNKIDEAVEIGLDSVKLTEGLARAMDCESIYDLPCTDENVTDIKRLIDKAIKLKKDRIKNAKG